MTTIINILETDMEENMTHITSVYDVLPREVIRKVVKDAKMQQNCCYYNAARCGIILECLGYDVRICQGHFNKEQHPLSGHSWNVIKKDGIDYYIDFTAECLLNHKINNGEYYITQIVDVDDLIEIFDYEEYAFHIFDGDYNPNLEEYVWYDEELNRHSKTGDEYVANFKVVKLSEAI